MGGRRRTSLLRTLAFSDRCSPDKENRSLCSFRWKVTSLTVYPTLSAKRCFFSVSEKGENKVINSMDTYKLILQFDFLFLFSALAKMKLPFEFEKRLAFIVV
jgi:hypothetical protein